MPLEAGLQDNLPWWVIFCFIIFCNAQNKTCISGTMRQSTMVWDLLFYKFLVLHSPWISHDWYAFQLHEQIQTCIDVVWVSIVFCDLTEDKQEKEEWCCHSLFLFTKQKKCNLVESFLLWNKYPLNKAMCLKVIHFF